MSALRNLGRPLLLALAGGAVLASMLVAPSPRASADTSTPGAVVVATNSASGGAGAVVTGGSGLTCFKDGSATIPGYKRGYKMVDRRCITSAGVLAQWLECPVYYHVWRFYGTKANPTAYMSLSKVALRSMPEDSEAPELCVGLDPNPETRVNLAGRLLATVPSPWDAETESGNGTYIPPAGESVWNVSTDDRFTGFNEQRDKLTGTYAFTPLVERAPGVDPRRVTASPAGRSGDVSTEEFNRQKYECYNSDTGVIRILGKLCPLAPTKPIWRSSPTNVTIDGERVTIRSCRDLTAAKLTAAGGPYSGQFATAEKWLAGQTGSPNDPQIVRDAAREKVQKLVSDNFVKLTTGQSTVDGSPVKLTRQFASALVGASSMLAVSPGRVFPSTPALVTSQLLSSKDSEPCGSVLDFALFSIPRANGVAIDSAGLPIAPVAATATSPTTPSSVPSTTVSANAQALASASNTSLDSQIRMGYCVAPVVQHAWLLRLNGDRALFKETYPNGKDDLPLALLEPRYGKPTSRSLANLRTPGELLSPLKQVEDITIRKQYKAAIPESLRALYKEDPQSVPLANWRPPTNTQQGLSYLLSPPSTGTIDERVQSAQDAVSCRTGYFTNGLLNVGSETIDTAIPEEGNTPVVVEPIRVSVEMPRALTASGTLAPQTVRVTDVSLWCGERLCNNAANPLDPTLVSATGQLTLTSSDPSYRACPTARSSNCDYFVEYQPSRGALLSQSLRVVFFSPTPAGVTLQPQLVLTDGRVQTYRMTYRQETVCTETTIIVEGKSEKGPPSCRTFTVEDGIKPFQIIPQGISFSPTADLRRVVAGSIGAN